ncbi:MAG TPA: hypothetical protein VMP01_03240 [Pirellulaceae bacterium]|nr:hypothetical protein [Pirellulaceae bacterium]
MPNFEDHLTASIASAKAKLADREKVQREMEAARLEEARARAARFFEVKGRAERFKNNHLEPLFRNVQKKLTEAGFFFIGNYINDEQENRGTVGSTLECGEHCYLQAVIVYSPDKSVARVDAQTSKGACYSASQDFNEGSSPAWFETNVAEATGKLLESGEVPTANVARFMAR